MKKVFPIIFILILCFVLVSCSFAGNVITQSVYEETVPEYLNRISEIPEFDGSSPYVKINDNIPFFDDSQITDKCYEFYSSLDNLGRCGMTEACVGIELMPTEERGEIGQVKPTGWQIAKYDFIDGKYLYNRCHLIGYQLSGENANVKNLITGTRYMNVQGMLPFENEVSEYIKETGNHVMYRVTPLFTEDNLVADGVLMEALSVEDNGKGIMFNVFCYNCQPGIEIDYATGNNREISGFAGHDESETRDFVLNVSSGKFHRPECSGVADMKDENKQEYRGLRQKLIEQGYKPCKICNP